MAWQLFSETNLTTLKSHKPQPALIVSATCRLIESGLFSGSTPTIPPWAYLELHSESWDLVINKIPSGKLTVSDNFIAA